MVLAFVFFIFIVEHQKWCLSDSVPSPATSTELETELTGQTLHLNHALQRKDFFFFVYFFL